MLGSIGSYGLISLLSLSVISASLKRKILALAVFSLALLSGVLIGFIEPVAIPFFCLFLAVGWLYEEGKIKPKFILLLGLIALSAVFALHLIPGLSNPVFLDEVSVSDNTVKYSQYINFDKAFIGVVLLLFVAQRIRKVDTNALLTVGAVSAITIVLILTFTMSVGQIQPDIKLPEFIAGWIAINLFITCAAEECMFRLLIQEPLQEGIGNTQKSAWIGMIASSLFFGLVHLPGGLYYVVGASFLSLGCAYGYYRTRNILIPIAIHFGFNLVHILFFSYPFIA